MTLRSGTTDFEEIKTDDFFQELNWNQVMNKEVHAGVLQGRNIAPEQPSRGTAKIDKLEPIWT
jgi:hypothetical protein